MYPTLREFLNVFYENLSGGDRRKETKTFLSLRR